MTKIKNIQDLINLKKSAEEKFSIRKNAESEDKIILRVAMGTCGIAAGAREVFNLLIEEIDKHKIENIVVTQTGCMGYCHAEPTVEVVKAGEDSILYGNVTKSKVKDIIEKHIMNGELLQDSIIGITHHKAE